MIRWRKNVRAAIALRLKRGAKPADIKASFNKLVDEMAEKTLTRDALLKRIAQLEAKLAKEK